MFSDDEQSEDTMLQIKSEEPLKPRRRAVKIKIPHRAKSEVIPPAKELIMTAGIKPKPIKLRQCLVNPLTLYELCAEVLDKLAFPNPFEWDEEQVANWMEEVVGLPQYKECITDNHINGRRLLRLEDPSVLPEINIHDFEHIKKITSEIRKVFATDYVLFARSVGLPFRKPLTYCTWFKSRTGPNWGIRQNWSRSDILRWMKIVMPKPLHLDHWDLVWYQRPDYPKELIARVVPPERTPDHIPYYVRPEDEFCNEYMAPRKFILQADIPKESQFIWMEHLPGSPRRRESMQKKKQEDKGGKITKVMTSRLFPKKISLTGLTGKDLILARRKMPKPKFLP